jgi:serine/threonine protein kinase
MLQCLAALWSTSLCMKEMMDGQPLFPGESDVDQLYLIQRMLGPLTKEQSARFMANPRFNGYKFGDDLASRPHTLEARFAIKVANGTIPAEAVDFMKQCLRFVYCWHKCLHACQTDAKTIWTCRMDPSERPTSSQCLCHEYFASIMSLREPIGSKWMPQQFSSQTSTESTADPSHASMADRFNAKVCLTVNDGWLLHPLVQGKEPCVWVRNLQVLACRMPHATQWELTAKHASKTSVRCGLLQMKRQSALNLHTVTAGYTRQRHVHTHHMLGGMALLPRNHRTPRIQLWAVL